MMVVKTSDTDVTFILKLVNWGRSWEIVIVCFGLLKRPKYNKSACCDRDEVIHSTDEGTQMLLNSPVHSSRFVAQSTLTLTGGYLELELSTRCCLSDYFIRRSGGISVTGEYMCNNFELMCAIPRSRPGSGLCYSAAVIHNWIHICAIHAFLFNHWSGYDLAPRNTLSLSFDRELAAIYSSQKTSE